MMDFFLQQPHETIIHIFHYLPTKDLQNLIGVNTLWKSIQADHSLWNSINFSGILNTKQLEKLTRIVTETHGQYIKKITITPAQGPFISNKMLINISEKCPNLTHLDLGSSLPNMEVTMSLKGKQLVNLKYLNLRHFKSFSTESVLSLKYCTKLEYLNVSDTYKGNNASFDKLIPDIGNYFPNLVFLNFLHNYVGYRTQFLSTIFKSCNRLEKLYCENISSKEIKDLIHYCPNISHLYLASTSQLRDIDIVAVAEKYKKLILFAIYSQQITNIGISALIMNCPQLTYLNLKFCRYVNEESIRFTFKHIPNLRFLEIPMIEPIREFLKNLPMLKVLILRNTNFTVPDRMALASRRIVTLENKDITEAIMEGVEPNWNKL